MRKLSYLFIIIAIMIAIFIPAESTNWMLLSCMLLCIFFALLISLWFPKITSYGTKKKS